MPIRPQQRWLYPIDWQKLTDMVRFERAIVGAKACRGFPDSGIPLRFDL